MYYLLLLVFFCLNHRFQPNVCNVCHDVSQRSMSFDDFAINNAGGNDYRINF